MNKLIRPLFAIALLMFATTAGSQTFPSRPVHIVVGFPPAGAADARVQHQIRLGRECAGMDHVPAFISILSL